MLLPGLLFLLLQPPGTSPPPPAAAQRHHEQEPAALGASGSYSKDDNEHICVPTSYLLPQTSSQYLGYEFCKKSYINSKTFHCDIHRSKKNNHVSNICSLPVGPRYKFGHPSVLYMVLQLEIIKKQESVQ
ncbi:hypothetical protein UY3_10581 [Chelonia mydas]|uniref:Uncharacterized protein n=1 Tax=Chelonia mydas TaxID=8469 RepID=M7BJT8_CHEMY|nr:hypothetical protein UY3_10581 [Chelonia mydas]